MKTCRIISALTLVLLLACSEDSPTAPEKSVYIDGQTYRNEIIGLQLSAPENWTLVMNQEVAGMQALLVGNRNDFSGLPPSFNITIDNANEMKSASELLSASEAYILENFPDAVFESKATCAAGEFNCANLVYTFEYNGVELKQRQILFLCERNASVALTFTTGKNSYEEISAEFDFILNSLKKLS